MDFKSCRKITEGIEQESEGVEAPHFPLLRLQRKEISTIAENPTPITHPSALCGSQKRTNFFNFFSSPKKAVAIARHGFLLPTKIILL
jgi:hypothetical protein